MVALRFTQQPPRTFRGGNLGLGLDQELCPNQMKYILVDTGGKFGVAFRTYRYGSIADPFLPVA